MARKKADISDAPVVETIDVPEPETPTVIEFDDSAPKYITNPESVQCVNTFDVHSELELARSQIEHCEDYLNVQGADYKGYMRGKIKEWRLYKYKLRQYSIGNAPLPVRPELVNDY